MYRTCQIAQELLQGHRPSVQKVDEVSIFLWLQNCKFVLAQFSAVLFESSLVLQVSEDPKMFLVDTPG